MFAVSQQDNPVPKKQLQLVGVTAMFLASKYEEMYPPEISDFAYVTDRAYTTAQIREMEMKILRVLKFQLGRPLPLQFLRRASKICEVRRQPVVLRLPLVGFCLVSRLRFIVVLPQVTADQHTLAKYLLELTMTDYEMVHFPPSMVACAALALALKILNAGDWVGSSEDLPLASVEHLPSLLNLATCCHPASRMQHLHTTWNTRQRV